MGRDPFNVDNDDLHCKALEAHQGKNDKDKGTQKDHPIFITGPTVVVQWEERGLWTHGVIVDHNNDDCRRHSYTI